MSSNPEALERDTGQQQPGVQTRSRTAIALSTPRASDDGSDSTSTKQIRHTAANAPAGWMASLGNKEPSLGSNGDEGEVTSARCPPFLRDARLLVAKGMASVSKSATDAMDLLRHVAPLAVVGPAAAKSGTRFAVLLVPDEGNARWQVLTTADGDGIVLNSAKSQTANVGRAYYDALTRNGHAPCISSERVLLGTDVPFEPITVMASDGTAVDAIYLPRHAAFKGLVRTDWVDFQANLRAEHFGWVRAVRSAVMGHANRAQIDVEPTAPPTPVEAFLQQSTADTISELAKLCRSMVVVVDDSKPEAAMYAMYGKAPALFIKMVGEMVSMGANDRQSDLLVLAQLRRTDHYVEVFGQADPSELALGFGPSLVAPSSSCLYMYRMDNPSVRVDIGQSNSFAQSLRSMPDDTPFVNTRRRLFDAVREETRYFRERSKRETTPCCNECRAPLTPLLAAQGLPTGDPLDRPGYI